MLASLALVACSEVAHQKAEDRKEESKPPAIPPLVPVEAKVEAKGDEDSGGFVAEPAPEPAPVKCAKGEVEVDGECLPEDKADEVIDQQADEALAELEQAPPEQAVAAQEKVIKAQSRKIDRQVDDLEDIKKALKRKKAKGEGPWAPDGAL